MQAVCSSRAEACVVPYADGGKQCQNTSECAGGCYFDFEEYCRDKGMHCFADYGPPRIGDRATGRCRVDNVPCGNFWKIDGGKIVDAYNAD